MTLRPAAAAAVLAATVLLTHLPLLRAGYVQDDHIAVEDNAIAASGRAGAIFGSGYWDQARGGDRSLYRPLTIGSFALELALAGGARPAVSHAVNLGLHALVCLMIFLLAARCRIPPWIALSAAMVFAVNPAKSEAVANVVGRSELLAALFTLAAVCLAFEHGSRAAAWGAAACVLAACGSKETGFAALPLVALAASGAGSRLGVAGMIAPSVLAMVVAVVARTVALQAFLPAQEVPVVDNPLVREHGVRYMATALALIPRYLRLMVFPFGLSNDYSGASIPIERSLFAPLPILGALIVTGLAWLASRGRLPLIFAAIIVLPYLLVSNLLVPAGAVFAERFTYLPFAGACLLAAWALRSATRRWAIPAAIVIVVLGVAMLARSRDWKDDATIFAATDRNNPKSPRAALWLGRWDDAIARWPESAAPWVEKGVALARSGDLPEAERALREAVRLEPGRAGPHLNLALVLHRAGRLEDAVRSIRKAILLDPDNPRALAELGHLRYQTGRMPEAAAAYERAVALGRTDLVPRLREISTPAPGDAPPR